MTRSTRSHIIFGSRLNDEYIAKDQFELIKHFVSLPPADYFLLDQEIVYLVPPSQIVRSSPTTTYKIHTDYEFSEAVFYQVECASPTHVYNTHHGGDGFDRITVLQETYDTEPFTLVENGQYSDVELRTRIRQVETIWNGDIWLWEFFESFRHPYRCPSDPRYLYFKDPSVYEIHLFAPSVVSKAQLFEFLRWSLPDRFNRFHDHCTPSRFMGEDPETTSGPTVRRDPQDGSPE